MFPFIAAEQVSELKYLELMPHVLPIATFSENEFKGTVKCFRERVAVRRDKRQEKTRLRKVIDVSEIHKLID